MSYCKSYDQRNRGWRTKNSVSEFQKAYADCGCGKRRDLLLQKVLNNCSAIIISRSTFLFVRSICFWVVVQKHGPFMCWASVFEFYLYLHPKENIWKLCLWMMKVSEMTILWATPKYLAVFSFRLPFFSRWSIWSSLRDKGTRLTLVFITLYCKHNLSSDFLLGLKLVCYQSPKLNYCILVILMC